MSAERTTTRRPCDGQTLRHCPLSYCRSVILQDPLTLFFISLPFALISSLLFPVSKSFFLPLTCSRSPNLTFLINPPFFVFVFFLGWGSHLRAVLARLCWSKEVFHGCLASLPSYRPTRLTHPLPRTPPPFHTALGLADTPPPPLSSCLRPPHSRRRRKKVERKKKREDGAAASAQSGPGDCGRATELWPCTPAVHGEPRPPARHVGSGRAAARSEMFPGGARGRRGDSARAGR